MDRLSEALLLFILLVNFLVLASMRLSFSIRAMAFQGILLGLLGLAQHGNLWPQGVALALITVAVKGVLLPAFLLWAIRETAIRREINPSLGPVASMVCGLLAAGLGFAVAGRMPLPQIAAGPLLIPASLTTLLSGFLVLTTRKKALTQVVGYLMLENGVYMFGLVLEGRVPLLVEAGVLLDLLVAVFIMGLVVFHMNRELDSIDSEELTELRH